MLFLCLKNPLPDLGGSWLLPKSPHDQFCGGLSSLKITHMIDPNQQIFIFFSLLTTQTKNFMFAIFNCCVPNSHVGLFTTHEDAAAKQSKTASLYRQRALFATMKFTEKPHACRFLFPGPALLSFLISAKFYNCWKKPTTWSSPS